MLLLACLFAAAQAFGQTTGKLPTYGASNSRAPIANPFSTAVVAGDSLPTCPHVCLIVPPGEAGDQAVKDFEEANHCKVGVPGGTSDPDDGANPVCTEQWREDESFLQISEGRLVTTGYVPVYSRDVVKGGKVIHKKGEAIGVSGVTISTGVDLGQQSASGTRRLLDDYVKEKGNPDQVDVDALMTKLDPYFGLKKQKAIDALDNTPLTVTKAEARLLEQAFGYDTQTRVAKQFDAKNTKGMTFKKLPEEAQTVLIDFAYQYGLSDSKGTVRQTFWKYVYDGDWKKLADWLKDNPDPYTSRRKREGDRLQRAIDDKKMPDSGDPCAPVAKPGDARKKEG